MNQLEQATGRQLDEIGNLLVGVRRARWETDRSYRSRLLAQYARIAGCTWPLPEPRVFWWARPLRWLGLR